MAKKHAAAYENNPFYVGLGGLKMLFNKAKNVAIYAIVMCAVMFVLNGIANISDTTSTISMSEAELKAQEKADEAALNAFFAQDTGVLVVTGILIASAAFVVIVVSLWLYGVFEYTAARMADDEKVGLKEALLESGRELSGYVWLYILMTVKILLWSLLLIVPGFIMAVRYSLAGTVFFAEGKRGNAAIKRSLELTKGGWFTTFGSQTLWNLITFGIINYLLLPGVNATLYKQFKSVTDSNEAKPSPHWLSWLTLVVPVIILGMIILLGVAVGMLVLMLAE